MFATLPRFQYDPEKGRFRDYLFRAARNAIARHMGRAGRPTGSADALDGLADSDSPERSAWQSAWESEWMNHHYRLALATVRTTFEPASVAIFERCLKGDSVRDIASSCNLSEQAVHKVKQRIRDRMRDLVADQIRDEEEA
jgi:DNA-directed RNA polymerase specialized sigma24 family protein